MKIAFDTETHMIRPGCLTPKMVCATFYDGEKRSIFKPGVDLFMKMRRHLLSDDVLVAHNVTYDLGVFCAEYPQLLPLVFQAYKENRIQCTLVRQKLIDIARGELEFREIMGRSVKTKHDLATLASIWLNLHVEKKDTWRENYAELTDVPLSEWPKEAIEYAENDAQVHYDVDRAQLEWAAREFETIPEKKDGVLPNQDPQFKAAWALHLIAAWGVRTDKESVRLLKEQLQFEVDSATPVLKEMGILRPDGTKDMAKIRSLVEESFKRRGLAVPTTEKGQIKTDADTLRETDSRELLVLESISHSAKILNTYIGQLELGVDRPITSRPNVLVATGRTSWSSPNLQNPPQKGGVRECFVPREGYYFCAVDYDTLELRALAQVCLDLFGFSQMAEALQNGEDLHAKLGAEFLGIGYKEMLRRLEDNDPAALKARQEAKGFNFGRPGGMGAMKMVEYLKHSGTVLHEEHYIACQIARTYIEKWHVAWPEMQNFFDYVVENIVNQNGGYLVQPRSGRVRGKVGFSDGANSHFQGLAADGAKAALWEVVRQCFTDKTSPLFGARPVLFLHDEIICEVPIAKAHEAAERQAELMVEGMSSFIPDIPITCKPVLMKKWYKGAKPVHLDGKLVPSKPQFFIDDGKKKIRWVADVE